MTPNDENVTPNQRPETLGEALRVAKEQANRTDGPYEADEVPFLLRALVIVLGIAIVVMLVLIGYGLIVGFDQEEADISAAGPVAGQIVAGEVPVTGGQVFEAAAGSATGVPVSGPQELTVLRPEEAFLVRVDHSTHEIMLHFRLKDGADQIILVNRATGKPVTLTVPAKGVPAVSSRGAGVQK